MNNNLQAQVIEAEEHLRQAMLDNDVRALDGLISPELLFTSLTGELASKEDDLASHRAGDLLLKELEPSQRQIQLPPRLRGRFGPDAPGGHLPGRTHRSTYPLYPSLGSRS